MFPYPSGAGLHMGHPLGFTATDMYARYQRATGHNVLYTMGFDAFGLPAEQYAVQTGQHPAHHHRGQNVANIRRQLRRLGLSHDLRRSIEHHRPRLLPLDAVDLPADLQLLVRPRAEQGAPDRRTGVPSSSAGTRAAKTGDWAAMSPGRAPCRARRVAPGLRERRAGELVPGPGHRGGQRRGHRRRAQRPRQLPRVQAQHAPVDDAHHRLRRPPDRRPGAAGLDRRDQVDAAQLDRPQRGRHRPLRFPRRHDHRVHHPARHACSARRSWCWRPSTRWSRRSPHPSRRRPSPPTAPRPRRRTTSSARTTPARRPACSPGPTPPTR